MAITGARVLIVDDDLASRRLLEVRLRPLECDVATAGNGEQGLSALRKDLPDLVLLDLQMPKMGGLEVLRDAPQGRDRCSGHSHYRPWFYRDCG